MNPPSDWFFMPGSALIGGTFALLGRARVSGLQHVPASGAFLLVSNHLSEVDPPLLGYAVGFRSRRVIHFMAKSEMRRWPLIGWLASQAGAFFVRRGEGDRAAQRQALELLAAGRPVGVFAEGTRSRKGTLQEPKLGAALLAMRSGVPLLPVAITNTDRLLLPGGVRVRIGETFRLPHRSSGRIDREELRACSDELMRHIAALLPPERRGLYR